MNVRLLSKEEVDAIAECLTPEKVEVMTEHFLKYGAIKELKPIAEILSLLTVNTANLIYTLRQCEERLAESQKELEITDKAYKAETAVAKHLEAEVERLAKENALHVIAHTEAGADLKRLRSANNDMIAQVLELKGEVFELTRDRLTAEVERLNKRPAEPMQGGQRDPEEFYQNNPPLQAWSGPAGGKS